MVPELNISAGEYSIKIDPETLTYALDRVKSFVGRDALSSAQFEHIANLIALGQIESGTVRILGMHQPVPIDGIYQKTGLKRPNEIPLEASGAARERGTHLFDLVRRGLSAIIVSGPGFGKSTLLHWAFQQLLREDRPDYLQDILPILVTLRREGAIDDLKKVVDALSSTKVKRRLPGKRAVLFIDGYDEVSETQRAAVSGMISAHISRHLDGVYLTCRKYYNVIDLPLNIYELEGFSRDDALRFTRAFGAATGADINAEALLSHMERHGLMSLAGHPLMLALVCIASTNVRGEARPVERLPKTPRGLIEEALQVLRVNWDCSRRVVRDSQCEEVSAGSRLGCLKRVAYEMDEAYARDCDVRNWVREQLVAEGLSKSDPRTLLTEMARAFGILVHDFSETWKFSHRTLHDYLAAEYWRESGAFRIKNVTKWDARAAYAIAGLSAISTSTRFIEQALSQAADLGIFMEIMSNGAVFSPEPVARSLTEWYKRHPAWVTVLELPSGIRVGTKDDIFGVLRDNLLQALIEHSAKESSDAASVVRTFAFSELLSRRGEMPVLAFQDIKSRFYLPGFSFEVLRSEGLAQFTIVDLERLPKLPVRPADETPTKGRRI